MLNILIDEYFNRGGTDIVTDVEKEFSTLTIQGTNIDKILIEKIEKGRYNDSISYIDRFGYKLHIDDLSTGCKAALCVANLPNKIIDLIECGNNARDAIIRYCSNGNIIIRDNGLTISTINGTETRVTMNGLKFNNIDDLNKYINDGMGFLKYVQK